ncbi:MAG TPA: farnesyl diphosphate synthase [Longimicrobium sp.]|nr:farnesyl diphosphate synthase [Longimicrobium sp.]
MTATAPLSGVAVEAFLARERERVNAALARTADAITAGAPAWLREPMRYALEAPGKRIRPVLCVSAWRAVHGGEAPDAVYRLAAAVEVVHTYSLVHDDLPSMDDDALRRGRPTVHTVHGVHRAMLAGAALITAAVRVLDDGARELELRPDTRRALVAELCRAGGAEGMVGGQLMDLEGEEKPLDSDALEAIHRRKTGALLAAALRLGGIAAGAGPAALAALSEYGQDLGLAFQIVDDVLDVTGSAAQLGKTAGKDQSAGKTTYPALFGLDGARARAESYVAAAVAALHAGGIESDALEATARYVLERRH